MSRRAAALPFAVALAVVAAARAQQTPLQPLPAATAQGPATGSGLIMGVVTDARGDAVGGAVVTLSGGFEVVALATYTRALSGGQRRTVTADDGHFVFFDLPKGSYSIEASKPGFLPGAYGRRRFNGPAQSINLGEGERNTQIKFQMWEYAVITGRITDETDEPLVGVPVRAMRRIVDQGTWRWESVVGETTDDRGQFRIDGLLPGEYVVIVQTLYSTTPAVSGPPDRLNPAAAFAPASGRVVGDWIFGSRSALVVPDPSSDGRARVYTTTFYPAARTIATAQKLTLASGDQRGGIDIRMQLVTTGPVSGVITSPDGPAAGASVRLVPEYVTQTTIDTGYDIATTTADAAGRFFLVGVPAGVYIARATLAPMSPGSAPGAPPPRVRRLDQPFVINDGDSTPADLVMSLPNSGATVSGRIAFDGALPIPAPELIAKLFVRLEPTDPKAMRAPGLYQVNYGRDGTFTVTDVPPGKYLVIHAAFVEERRAMAGWETKGATLDGKDVSTLPLDVQGDVRDIVMTITDHPSKLSGSVRGVTGGADPHAVVVLFPTDKNVWLAQGLSNRRMRTVRAAENGTYTIGNIPAGQYFVAAIPDEFAADWNDPDVLETIPRTAMRVSIVDAEQKVHDLTTLRIQR